VLNALKHTLAVALLSTLPCHGFASASNTPLDEKSVDVLVESAMSNFQVPGVAVGIIKDGKVVLSKGYGVRENGKPSPVTPETLFSIASVSKAFTAAALALLVDDGLLRWEDKVTKHLPQFQLYDPWVTREFAVRDLLIHNSGLGIGAGDLMFWPSSDTSREDIIANLKHLKPVSSFRSEFAYDNLLYIAAGELVLAITGKSFEDFVDQRILRPLQMNHCAANRTRLKQENNIAEPHILAQGNLEKATRLEAVHEPAVIAAAGGLQCSVDSLLQWLAMHLNEGVTADGKQFLSKQQQANLVGAHTLIGISELEHQWFNTRFRSYGLGWEVKDVYGYKWIGHGGSLLGMVSTVAMIPELDLGIVVLTNQQSGSALDTIVFSILDAYAGQEKNNWIARFKSLDEESTTEADQILIKIEDNREPFDASLDNFVGVYRDQWFGDVEISAQDQGLYFRSKRSTRLRGKMIPYRGNVFTVHWDDRSLDADAYINFSTDFNGHPNGMTMQAISPATDFSYDFHDLSFVRTDPPKELP
jgi:CubicO group peptidase (beta-lactamase class C family)